jgi:hypothetical protein
MSFECSSNVLNRFTVLVCLAVCLASIVTKQYLADLSQACYCQDIQGTGFGDLFAVFTLCLVRRSLPWP